MWILSIGGVASGRVSMQPAKQACFGVFTESAPRPIQSISSDVRGMLFVVQFVNIFVLILYTPIYKGPRTE